VQATDRRRCGSKLVVTLRIELWFDAMSFPGCGESYRHDTRTECAALEIRALMRGGGEEG